MTSAAALPIDRQALAGDPAALALAARLARAKGRDHPELADEFPSAANLALVKAAGTYNPAFGMPFLIYAHYRINGALVDCERSYMPAGFRRRDREQMPHTGSLDVLRFCDEFGRDWRLEHVLADGSEPVGTGIEFQDELDILTRRLPATHATVLKMYYGRCGRNMRRIGEALGVSESRICQIHAEAIELAREDIVLQASIQADHSAWLHLRDRRLHGNRTPDDDHDCVRCRGPLSPRGRCFQCSPMDTPPPLPETRADITPQPPAKAEERTCSRCGQKFVHGYYRKCETCRQPNVGRLSGSIEMPPDVGGGRTTAVSASADVAATGSAVATRLDVMGWQAVSRAPAASVPEPTLPAPAHTSQVADVVGGLRTIVAILSTMGDEDARWVVDAAYQLSRETGR